MLDFGKYHIYGNDRRSNFIRNWHNIAKQKEPHVSDWDPRSMHYDDDGVSRNLEWRAARETQNNFRKRHPVPRIKILRKESKDMLNLKMLNPLYLSESVLSGALVGAGIGATISSPFVIRGFRMCSKLKKGILAAQTPEECAKNIDDVYNSSLFHDFTHECEKVVKGEMGLSSQIGSTENGGAVYTMLTARQRFAMLIQQSGDDWKRSCLSYVKRMRIGWGIFASAFAGVGALQGSVVGYRPSFL